MSSSIRYEGIIFCELRNSFTVSYMASRYVLGSLVTSAERLRLRAVHSSAFPFHTFITTDSVALLRSLVPQQGGLLRSRLRLRHRHRHRHQRARQKPTRCTIPQTKHSRASSSFPTAQLGLNHRRFHGRFHGASSI